MSQHPASVGVNLYGIPQPTQGVITTLLRRIQALESRPMTLGGHPLQGVGDPVAPQDAVTLAYLDQTLNPQAIATDLSAQGRAPLDVHGLRGVLADPQTMGIRVIPDANSLPPAHLSRASEVIVWRGVMYYLSPSPAPGAWTVLTTAAAILSGPHGSRPLPAALPLTSSNTLYWETDRLHLYRLDVTTRTWVVMEGVGGPMRGTLSPDTKPGDLGAADSGFHFRSTDFARDYRWNGGGWNDAPGSPPRFQVALFHAAPSPGEGWAVCNGAAATASTSSGGTTSYTRPNIAVGDFLRIGTPGVTGGSETHTHTGTTAEGSTILVHEDPPDIEVADATHTHDITVDPGSSLPPYYEVLAYVRL
jgi:hypothetical protein